MSQTLTRQGSRRPDAELGTNVSAQIPDAAWRSQGLGHARSVARVRWLGTPGRSIHMPTTISAEAPTPTPIHAMFDLEDIQSHYRIAKTKTTELVNDPAFLNSVVPGMHRYPEAAIEAYDLAVALAGTAADPANATPPPPVVIARPAPGKPGPKPKPASNPKAA